MAGQLDEGYINTGEVESTEALERERGANDKAGRRIGRIQGTI